MIDGNKVPMFSLAEIFTRYGYLGVNLFFMISGFVILFSALNRSPFKFAIARMDRLYPVYWVSVTLTAASATILTDSIITIKQYLMNLTMINDYFNIKSIDGVYWTLHIELKFYFLIFLLMLTRQIQYYRVWIPVWLAITLSYLIFSQPFFMGWFINPYYSSYFISGILFYLIYANGMNWRRLSILFISMCISIYYSIGQVDGFIAGPTFTDRVVASIIVISFYALFFAICSRLFTVKGSKILLTASGLTYPIYLLHARIGKTLYDLISQCLNKYFTLVAITLFIIILSFIVYTFVERKFSGQISRLFLSAFTSKSQ